MVDLAIGFESDNSWGKMHILERWSLKQPWRKSLPVSFPKPA